MPNANLLIRLRDLHEELASINDDFDVANSVDEDTVDALGQLVTDVSGLVDRAKEMAHPEESVQDRLTILKRIQHFDSAHPAVTRFLSQVADTLAMMGI